MEWLEAVVHTTTFGSDLVSDEMMARGAAGTEIVDRADVPDPRQPGVYWELYDPAMIDAMPDDVLVKAWFERGEKERETIEAVRNCHILIYQIKSCFSWLLSCTC